MFGPSLVFRDQSNSLPPIACLIEQTLVCLGTMMLNHSKASVGVVEKGVTTPRH
jgi:hypothetical protein